MRTLKEVILQKELLANLTDKDINHLTKLDKNFYNLMFLERIKNFAKHVRTSIEFIPVNQGMFFLLGNGDLYAYGYNRYGQLGLKDCKTYQTPIKVNFPNAEKIAAVVTRAHRSFFLTREAEVYVCGDNKFVPSKLFFDDPRVKIKTIKMGKNANFFITTEGDLYASGINGWHQLEIPSDDSRYEYFIEVPVKVHIQDDKKIVDVICVTGHNNHDSTFILTMDGEVFANGNNLNGELGIKGDSCIKQPQKLPGLEGNSIVSITILETQTTNYDFSVYLLTTLSEVFVFGSNDRGQLGLGHHKTVRIPTKINFPNSEKIEKLAVYFYAVFFKTTEKNIYACGFNGNNKLGLENIESVNIPHKIPFPENTQIEEIVFIDNYFEPGTFFLTKKGEVYVCGGTQEILHGLNFSDKFTGKLYKLNLPKNVKVSQILSCPQGIFFRSTGGDIYSLRIGVISLLLSSKYVRKSINQSNGKCLQVVPHLEKGDRYFCSEEQPVFFATNMRSIYVAGNISKKFISEWTFLAKQPHSPYKVKNFKDKYDLYSHFAVNSSFWLSEWFSLEDVGGQKGLALLKSYCSKSSSKKRSGFFKLELEANYKNIIKACLRENFELVSLICDKQTSEKEKLVSLKALLKKITLKVSACEKIAKNSDLFAVLLIIEIELNLEENISDLPSILKPF